jgi:hypothetical protein
MSNPTQTATLVAPSGFSGHPKTFRIEYDTLASLGQSIFDLSLDTGISLENAVITLSDGKSYRCDESGMHLCFGTKKRIISFLLCSYKIMLHLCSAKTHTECHPYRELRLMLTMIWRAFFMPIHIAAVFPITFLLSGGNLYVFWRTGNGSRFSALMPKYIQL